MAGGAVVGASGGPLTAVGTTALGSTLGAGLGAIATNIIGLGREVGQGAYYGINDWSYGTNTSKTAGFAVHDLGYNAWSSAVAIESLGTSCEEACAQDFGCRYPA